MKRGELCGRVLVIEDMQWVGESYVRALEGLAYDVTVVGTFREANELLSPGAWSTTRFDVVLADIKLPDGDSLPLVVTATELEPWPVVVVISAFLDEANTTTFTRLGAMYVPKPFSPAKLVELMDSVERRRADFPTRYAREFALSCREAEVLRQALRGHTLEDAARGLGVTVGSVKQLWRRIFAKTGRTSRQDVLSDLVDRWADDRRNG